jgi:hypothetical protein
MFHTTGDIGQYVIDLQDFLAAMTVAGLSAEKLCGSVWHFPPSKQNSDSTSSFHLNKPHKVGKISHLEPRRFGRRLNRMYGWTRETFASHYKDE